MRRHGRLIDISGALVCHRKAWLHLFLRPPLLPSPLASSSSPSGRHHPPRYLTLVHTRPVERFTLHRRGISLVFSFNYSIVRLDNARNPSPSYRSKSAKRRDTLENYCSPVFRSVPRSIRSIRSILTPPSTLSRDRKCRRPSARSPRFLVRRFRSFVTIDREGKLENRIHQLPCAAH